MKKLMFLSIIAVSFLLSFTLISNGEEKSEETVAKKETKEVKEVTESINKKLDEVEKMDFTKIKNSNQLPDYDAHAGLD